MLNPFRRKQPSEYTEEDVFELLRMLLDAHKRYDMPMRDDCEPIIIKLGKTAVPVLREHLHTDDQYLKLTVLHILSCMGNDARGAMPGLKLLMRDTDPVAKTVLIDIFMKLNYELEWCLESCFWILEEHYDEDPGVIEWLLWYPEKTLPRLLEFIQDSSRRVWPRYEIARVMDGFGRLNKQQMVKVEKELRKLLGEPELVMSDWASEQRHRLHEQYLEERKQ